MVCLNYCNHWYWWFLCRLVLNSMFNVMSQPHTLGTIYLVQSSAQQATSWLNAEIFPNDVHWLQTINNWQFWGNIFSKHHCPGWEDVFCQIESRPAPTVKEFWHNKETVAVFMTVLIIGIFAPGHSAQPAAFILPSLTPRLSSTWFCKNLDE